MERLEKLIKSPTYHYTKLQNKIVGEILEYIDSNKEMNQTKFGEKIGVKRARVSQILNEGSDIKLSNFIRLILATGKVPKIEFLDADEFLKTELEKREENKPLDLEGFERRIKEIKSNKKRFSEWA